ncbi:MAG TPA: FAD/NAD(P)-binding protein, partial [Sandaracinaceae bacterium]
MVAANLLRLARGPLHVTLFDRQPAFGEGPAYRTADPRHLLNVPASNMSAWPDRPAHFLEWARARDPSVTASTFVPRRTYGEYVRAAFFEAAAGAGEHASVELLRREVLRADRAGTSFWLHDDRGEVTRADVLVVTTGHRPPSDPLRGRWSGSRARYVEDPWSSLALSAIAQDEPVLLLGTGLTAIDVLLTLTRDPRTAPITAVSRRGLVPAAHVLPMPPRVDPRWIEPLLEAGPTARGLISSLRRTVRAIEREGGDWRSVVDGLRAITPRVWASLGETEARRWLRHVRPFWEVHRHRAAPEVARSFEAMRARGELRVIAGRARAASGDVDGVWVELEARGGARREERFAWVVNCTGPGAGVPPFVESLAQNGLVRLDPLGLGLVTDDAGRAVTERGARDDLLVVGTLRKPALWESTAVPELRVQAAQVARAALWALGDPASFD